MLRPLLFALALPAVAADFARDVQPIFEAKCLKCHGPEKQKSGYRLDTKRIALTGGDNHAPNIVPGKSAASPLVKFISGEDQDMRMPPKGDPLTATEIATIRAWIDAGAEWPQTAGVKDADPLDWWSLKPLVKPVVPVGSDHPIDAFVRAKLATHGLAPSPEADARTLCRRLYFDLTGLPPTPDEMEAFASNSIRNPQPAIRNLIDRLLASPRYGERWARHWLDVVHYADTHGFDKDKLRPNAWPYRDYVIRALNEDKPYARFVQEQIAGDVLFPGTRDGVEALGFIAAGPWDFIGHEELPETKIDGKIARHLDRDDMVANTLGTFCSATAHCAQCHNHKFDPITQEDYFSLQAVFAGLDRAEKPYDLDPAIAKQRRALQDREHTAKAAHETLQAQLQNAAGPELAALEKKIADAEKAAAQGRRPEYGWHSAIAGDVEKRVWVQVDLGRSVALDRVALAGVWDDFNGIGAGFGFPVRFRIEASDDAEFRGAPLVIAAHDLTDYTNPGTAPQIFAAAGRTARYVRVTATKLAPRKNDFIFALSELEVFDTTGTNVARGATVESPESIEAPPRWRRTNLTDGIYPAATGGGPQLADLRRERDALLARALDASTRATLAEAERSLADIRAQLAQLPPAQSVYAGTVHAGRGNFSGAPSGQPRPIFLLARGQITQPLREVDPGALSALAFQPARFAAGAEGERRAALAGWITDPQNPLTWRSIVNRVWQYHFGRGLVDTANDFGRMGTQPSHPELLDWLAAEFRDRGGSLKWLHRLIVTSATWRQSSAGHPAAEKVDANNGLLWRQNRRKLEAEAVRDAVLAVSGKLDLTAGGPGWRDFVIERPEHSPHYKYDQANPDDPATWRRSIYRFIVRSQTQPWMTALDCADPSMRVDRRNESLSAPQALALLNNGFMLAQSRHFAARVHRTTPDLVAQVEHAHRLAFGRAPTAAEQGKLVDYAKANGLPQLCRVLLNLNEFAFVD